MQAFLTAYLEVSELCECHPRIDDIFSGALELRTAADTATRALSRQVLFHILQQCPRIDVASLNAATRGRYAYRSLAGYAAVARVVSKSLEAFIGRLPAVAHQLTVKRAQQALDAPHAEALRSLGLV